MDNTTFFLGANSAQGFHSLYSDFAAGPGDVLHIIKAGPGTGKSTFMRKIGQAARERGYAVESIICSGDPDSLDGVYIPALGVGFADGTAPHVLDPDFFAATGDYVNLGRFCDTEGVRRHSAAIRDVTQKYKGQYSTAYAYLAAAGAVDAVRGEAFQTPEVLAAVARRADSAVRRECGGRRKKAPGSVTRRFLSAASCKGQMRLDGTLAALCGQVYCLENRCGLADAYLRQLLSGAVAAGADVIACPSPLRPDTLEAVLFPDRGVGFLACGQKDAPKGVDVKWVHLDSLPEKDLLKDQRRALLESGKMKAALLDRACRYLKAAKAFHDELETYYKPYLDLQGLNGYTKDVIWELFG